jgi:undecaprenyl-diphosphatase
LFHAINDWPDSISPFLTFFSNAMNYPAVKIVLGILLLVLIAAGARTRRTAIQALIAFPIANGMTELFKNYLPEHRPYQDMPGAVHLHVTTSPSFGTASAHAANMAAVAFVFAYHLRWWGSPWVAIAILTGFSRVYVGVHYPYQVLLGWTCGIVAALAVTKGWDLIQTKRSSVIVAKKQDENEKVD